MPELAIGSEVPDFELPATSGQSIRLSDYRGQFVVLYFYPKDNTPGCTQEAIDFRDNISLFASAGAVVFGVSRDSVRVHEGFKSKQCLPFELLSDADESLCQLFDVIKLKSMYGKQVRGIERSTFVIDGEGVLVKEWRKVKVKDHCQAVLNALAQLQGQVTNFA